jgi:hypothetical protein
MSFLSKIFGGEKEHLPLDPASAEGRRFERYREVVTAFAGKLHDRLEVVPGERILYAFIGNPPEAFGIAWFEGGEEHNLKTLMKARSLSTERVQRISRELREAYMRWQAEPRYDVHLGKKKVVVTPSPALEKELLQIIHEATD